MSNILPPSIRLYAQCVQETKAVRQKLKELHVRHRELKTDVTTWMEESDVDVLKVRATDTDNTNRNEQTNGAGGMIIEKKAGVVRFAGLNHDQLVHLLIQYFSNLDDPSETPVQRAAKLLGVLKNKSLRPSRVVTTLSCRSK